MNDPFIEVQIEVNETVDTTVHVSDVVYAANRIPMVKRWNIIASIFNHIELDESKLDDKKDALTDEQKELALKRLEKQVAKFKASRP